MRRLSLNWFRSLSYSPPDAARQDDSQSGDDSSCTRIRTYTTIPEDRILDVQNVMWVAYGHTAAPESDELTVNSGDKVHIVESFEKRLGWCLVSLITDDDDTAAAAAGGRRQGWIPASSLRSPSPSSAPIADSSSQEVQASVHIALHVSTEAVCRVKTVKSRISSEPCRLIVPRCHF